VDRLKTTAETELIWFGCHANLQKIVTTDHSLQADGNVIHSVDSVRDLGVVLDSELTLQRHVNKVTSVCYYHIRRLKPFSGCWDLTPHPLLSLRSC